MASILKVDALQGITSAGDITVTSEGGSATQSLQQGLAKLWHNFNGTGTAATRDSLNVSSLTDDSTGRYGTSITSAFDNADNYNLVFFANADSGVNENNFVNARCGIAGQGQRATNSFRVSSYNGSAYTDSYWVNITVNGDLA